MENKKSAVEKVIANYSADSSSDTSGTSQYTPKHVTKKDRHF